MSVARQRLRRPTFRYWTNIAARASIRSWRRATPGCVVATSSRNGMVWTMPFDFVAEVVG
ncbi:hypothetical protein ACFXAZ_23600 [Streptomyces sp. NPDC059477]|uniref:hypothetical protein n=1 Tax=Streptomyces sp. NPDC059477 TaxID=3346847 RepID=UPI0036A23D7D